ncbi:MAG TPA: serine/threonine-protein kinase [Kofleriaceae bacterium]
MSPAAQIGSSASSYQILAKLAKGGMAEIFLARAATGAGVARFVVLKRVLRERASDFQFLRMFLDEARLAAQLQHPNIAQVYDVGKLGDSYFFTMEYVHGVTVRELGNKLGATPVPLACVLALAHGAAAGLHHAHERIGIDGQPLGIVHRDVSPSNLMISFEGHVKVVDFGVAKAASREHETQSGTVRGKISYLSPEQASGQDVDRRSDVFSLGIVMWELITGRRLFKRASDYASMAAIIEEPTPAPSTLRPEVPPDLDAVVLRALAKRPDDRFQTAQELVEAVELIAVNTMALSNASLSRFIRELFGSRPEPWIGLQEPEDRTSFTVTAEPVPKELIVPPTSDIDRRLAAVTDLSVTVHIDDARRTVPVMVIDRDPTTATPTAPVAFASARPELTMTAPTEATKLWRPRLPLLIGGFAFVLAISLVIAATIGLSPDRNPVAVPVASTEPAPPVAPTAAPTVDETESNRAPVPTPAPASEPPPEPPTETAPAPAEPPTIEMLGTAEAPKTARRLPTNRETFAACERGAQPKASPACVLAACRLRESGKATAWYAKLAPAKRGGLAAKCRAAGVTVDKPAPNCDDDPSRCQF